MGPYRTKAVICEDYVPPQKDVFKYMELPHDKECCTCCGSKFRYVLEPITDSYTNYVVRVYCHPFKRIPVLGILWWKKLCPLKGVHAHITCQRCSAHFVTNYHNGEAKEVLI